MTAGALLARAREAAGLSIADAAAQMRLSPRQVQALEADRYEELPGAVFVRGFVRNYARVLKLDPAPLLHALEPALSDDDAPLRVRETSGTLPLSARRDHVRPLFILFCLVVIVVAVAGGYELWSGQQNEPSSNRGTFTDAGAPQSVVTEQPKPPAPENMSPQPPAEHAQQPSASAESVPGTTPNPAAASAVEPAASTAHKGRMVVSFMADSWLEVRDRKGTVIYSGTGAAGTERVFEDAAPLSLVIGNASGVRITYNGRALDLSAYAARNIARLTLE